MRSSAVGAAMLAIAACDSPTPPPTPIPVAVEVTPASLALSWIGAESRLNAVLRLDSGAAADAATFTWLSGDTTIVTVDSTGTVTAMGIGSTLVTVGSQGLSTTVAVDVTQQPDRIVVQPNPIAFTAVGDTVRLQATVLDAGGTSVPSATITWVSGDSTVVIVDTAGLVTARGAGVTAVSARSGPAEGRVEVQVTPSPASLTLQPLAVDLASLGETLQLTTQIADANGVPIPGVRPTWSSSDPTVVGVDSTGVVTAIGNGEAEVSATVGPLGASATVRVTQVATAVVVSPNSVVLSAFGATALLTAEARDALGSPLAFFQPVWTSATPSVASVDSTGTVTARGNGTGLVSVMVGAVGDSATVRVDFPTPVVATAARAAAGESFTCALDSGGRAWCWGYNREHQLGDGSGVHQGTPVPVAGSHIFQSLSISSGGTHACGLSATAGALCWGDDAYGQITGSASGGTAPAPVPLPVTGPVVQVVAGGEHTCVLSGSGSTTCWGRNNEGQLGRGTVGGTGGPAPVSGAPPFVFLSAGRGHTCGLVASGEAWCWGGNWWGQVGIGTTNQLGVLPTPVQGGHLWRTLSSGFDSTCGIDTAGQGFCWGRIYPAQPTAVPGLPSVTDIAAGGEFGCAVEASGAAWCWGSNGSGQLSGSSQAYETSAVRVTGGLTLRTPLLGRAHACAIDAAGGLHCWGGNRSGQLGVGGVVQAATPTRVPGTAGFTAVAAGDRSTCALDASGRAHCWGGAWGSSGPSPLDPGLSLTSLNPGPDQYCGVAVGGQGYCWGTQIWGRLGTGSVASPLSPTPIASAVPLRDVATSQFTSCALDALLGELLCWGSSGGYQFGGHLLGNPPVPTAAAPGFSFERVVRGDRHGCGLQSTGTVLCWGGGEGLGSPRPVSGPPEPVSGGHTFTHLTAEDNTTCAIDTSARAWCWGRLLGSALASSNVPIPVAGNHAFADVTAGRSNSCGIDTAGGLLCWGNGQYGAFGTLRSFVPEPTTVPLPAAALAVAPAPYHMCAIAADGWLYCWGMNYDGQLGLPVTLMSRNPLRVLGF